MKQKRQAKIIELIQNNDVETQEELLAMLQQEGFQTTQATISRDIRELNLTKTTGDSGRQKYVPGRTVNRESKASYRQLLNTGIVSMEAAGNIIVVKTISGVAMAVAAALDNMDIEGLIGCIAGDDTIFLAVRSSELIQQVISEINNVSVLK